MMREREIDQEVKAIATWFWTVREEKKQ